MAILDVRIDDRLIHGQVCGFWIPHYSLERIAIVDDEIVNDEIRKTVFVSPEEKAAFAELVEMGIPVYSQMVPNEAREDISELLRN